MPRPTRPAAPPEVFTAYLVTRLEHRMRQCFEQHLRDAGAESSFPALTVLTVLDAGESPSGAELARRCLVTAQTMQLMLKRLEGLGYIRARAEIGTARTLRWALTRSGSRALELARQVLQPVVAQMETALSPAALLRFKSDVEALTARLESLYPVRHASDSHRGAA
jgi:DNA-binding MarR family transcriptional regulator